MTYKLYITLYTFLPHPKPHITCYVPMYPDVEPSHIKRNWVVSLNSPAKVESVFVIGCHMLSY